MAINRCYFKREKTIITAYCLSRKPKELQEMKVVRLNNLIQTLLEFQKTGKAFSISDEDNRVQ